MADGLRWCGACAAKSEELTLLLGGIDLMQAKARNWYRKTLPEY
jgi:hypothetical protein